MHADILLFVISLCSLIVSNFTVLSNVSSYIPKRGVTNRKSRANQVMVHTVGSKSFARVAVEKVTCLHITHPYL